MTVKPILLLLASLCTYQAADSQLLKDVKKIIKNTKETAREVTGATQEVTRTVQAVKVLKKTWEKDTSSNIKYKQVPDYRTREEVNLNKKQKLEVENGEFKGLTWQPVTKFDNQIFPSFIIGWANYKGSKDEDMGSSLGFQISTSLPNIVLKWEIECADKTFFSLDSGYINCDEIRNGRSFLPKINWNYKELSRHQSNTPVNVYFRLSDPNTGGRVEKLVTINLRSISDCLLAVKSNNTVKSFRFMFASYVNEDHPAIDQISRDMLSTKMIDAVLGYQDGVNQVDLQIAALWRVLHDKGFQYSSITDNSGDGSQSIFSQTVRTFDKSLQTSQANCVDGTVLMASILKKIGIRPILVTVPGHCFLAYYTNQTDTSLQSVRFLETTMLSKSDLIKNPKTSVKSLAEKYKVTAAEVEKLLAEVIPPATKLSEQNKAYYLAFLDAKLSGKNAYDYYMKKYGAANVNLLDVSELRKFIKPIPAYIN